MAVWSRGAVPVAIALAVFVAGCGREGDTTAAESASTPAAGPTSTLTPTPDPMGLRDPDLGPPVEVASAGESAVGSHDAVAIAERFIHHRDSGEYREMMALIDPDYRDRPSYVPGSSVAQINTFDSQLEFVADEPTVCEKTSTGAACEWRGQDGMARALGYQTQWDFSFTIEDDLITNIVVRANDSVVLPPLATWVDEQYPDEPGCTPGHPDGPVYEPLAIEDSDGVPYARACAKKLIKYAAEFGETDLYVEPAPLG